MNTLAILQEVVRSRIENLKLRIDLHGYRNGRGSTIMDADAGALRELEELSKFLRRMEKSE